MTHPAMTSRRETRDTPAAEAHRPSRAGAMAQVNVRRPVVVGTLAATIVILLSLSMAGQISKHFLGMGHLFGFVDFFYVDRELTPPTWFASMQLLLSSALLFAVARQARRAGDRFARHWFALSVIFLFLSVDEMSAFHERLMSPISRVWELPTGMWAPTWVVPALVFVGIVGLAFLRFFLSFGWRQRFQLAAAGGLFVAGAIGIEMMTGHLLLPEGAELAPGYRETFRYTVLAHVEEALELVGILLFVDFLLRRLERGPGLAVAFRPAPAR